MDNGHRFFNLTRIPVSSVLADGKSSTAGETARHGGCDSLLGQSSSVAFMSNDSNPLSRRFMAQGPHAVTWLIPPNVPRHRKKGRSLPLGRRPRKLRSISSRVTYRHIEVVPIHNIYIYVYIHMSYLTWDDWIPLT